MKDLGEDPDLICSYGFQKTLLSWLRRKKHRRLIFVVESSEHLPSDLVPDHENSWCFGCVKAPGLNDRKLASIALIRANLRSFNRGSFHVSPNTKNFRGRALGPEALRRDPRLQCQVLETVLQVEPLAKQIARSSVFLNVELVDSLHSSQFPLFARVFFQEKRLAELTLADAIDFGSLALANARINLAQPFHSALDLQGAFAKTPAVILGAGPSLEKHLPLLSSLQDKALFLAGGTTLRCLPFSPHIAFGLDPKVPTPLKDPTVPFCFPSRIAPESLSGLLGPRLLVPDSHFAFLNWLIDREEPFDAGWTVGTLQTAMALHWGCDPLLFVGMDFCYFDGKKYMGSVKKEENSLIFCRNASGEEVATQRDWEMAALWIEEKRRAHPKRHFWSLSEGLEVGERISPQRLRWPFRKNLRAQIEQKILRTKLRTCSRCAEWKEHLLASSPLCEEKLLQPLWQAWQGVFQREMLVDSRAFPLEEKMKIQRLLFQKRVIQEQLHAFLE